MIQKDFGIYQTIVAFFHDDRVPFFLAALIAYHRKLVAKIKGIPADHFHTLWQNNAVQIAARPERRAGVHQRSRTVSYCYRT